MKNKGLRVNKLEVTAFVSGFVLMVYELAGARILAPSIGSSTYVWTSVIGIIIAALSLGYWMGGRVADSRGYMIDIARLCLAIGLSVAYTLVAYMTLLEWVAATFVDPRWQGVVASLLLFAPTSFLLGMLSPYLAKMNVRSLKTTGSSIASLSALNSMGGIVGTFTAGFVMFSYIGSHETLASLALVMVGLSWLIGPKIQWKIRAGLSVIIVIVLASPQQVAQGISIDTASARYTVFENMPWTGGAIRAIATGPSAVQSGVYETRPNDLAFWYTQQLAGVVAASPQRKDILVLGGGAFTLPGYLADTYPESTVDVVEIDNELLAISREHFNYRDRPNLNLIFDDARAYINRAAKQYDIVIVDVYSDTHVPFTMLTREYGDKINAITQPGGTVAVNMIAGTREGCLTLLGALDAPYRAHLPHVRYVVENSQEPYDNIIAAYSREKREFPGLVPLDLPGSILYTDNFAPAEKLQDDCRKMRESAT